MVTDLNVVIKTQIRNKGSGEILKNKSFGEFYKKYFQKVNVSIIVCKKKKKSYCHYFHKGMNGIHVISYGMQYACLPCIS